MNENPYASPAAESAPDPLEQADRGIRFVVVSLRVVGWVALTWYTLGGVIGGVKFIQDWLAGKIVPAEVVLGIVVILVIVGSFFFWFRVAAGLSRCEPWAASGARILFGVLLVFFPVGTVLAAVCLVKLSRYYSIVVNHSTRRGTTRVDPLAGSAPLTPIVPLSEAT